LGRHLWRNVFVRQQNCEVTKNYRIKNNPAFYFKVNWTENLAKCCSLGMDPIMFTSWEEQQCVTNFTSRKFKQFIVPLPYFELLILENWNGNLNYWTGGKQGCKGQWNWCSGAESKSFTANLSWATNQPEFAKEKENCLHMRVFQNKSGVLLSDRECKDKYIFACKVGILKHLTE